MNLERILVESVFVGGVVAFSDMQVGRIDGLVPVICVCVCAVRGAGGKRVGQVAAVREGDVM